MQAAGISTFRQAKWTWPVALLLLAQISLYTALAPRGFEFTDEAFYLLNGLHWREFTAVYTLFGAYLELPMRASGDSLTAMRLFNLLSLLVSGAILGSELQKHVGTGRTAPRIAPSLYWLAGAAGGLYFFGVLSTLRVPSYNSIALCTAALATALLLRGLNAHSTRSRLACGLAYGFVMGICGLSKASTGFLVGCIHLIYFCVANRAWNARASAQLVSCVVAGLGLQLALMTIVHPGWLAAIQAGASLFSYDTGGKLGGMVNDFRWDIQRLMRWSPLALLGLAGWAGLVRSLRPRPGNLLISWLSVLLTAGVVVLWLQTDQVRYWWPAALLLTLALLVAQIMGRPRLGLQPADRAEAGLWLLLFTLPFAISFGTNMSVFWHCQVAAMFVVLLLVVRLERLWQEGSISAAATTIAICLLCFPPLVFQLRAAQDPAYVYRLTESLQMQREPWTTPVGTVWVDADTSRTLAGLHTASQNAGLAKGQPMLDFTGDGPGLILALAGNPVGVAWLVGGYPDSGRWAKRLVQSLPAEKLRAAWVLSSPDNPRAIPGWSDMLEQKIGVGSHELVAVLPVRAPSLWGEQPSPTATLCLWRPLNGKLAAAAQLTASTASISCAAAQPENVVRK